MERNKSYGSIARKETNKIFFKNFINMLETYLTKYFGESECKRVLEALNTGKIEIIDIENFLYANSSVSDKTIEIYNSTRSAEEFFYNSLLYFKKAAESGASYIVVREFLLVLVDMMRKKEYELTKDKLTNYLKIFFHTLKNATHESPFHIQVLDPRFYKTVKGKLNLSMVKYKEFAPIFFETYKDIPVDPFHKREFFPKLELIYPVYPDTRGNQEQFIASIYRIPKYHSRAVLKDVKDLAEDVDNLYKGLDVLDSETGLSPNRESVVIELKRIKELNPIKLYPDLRTYNSAFNQMGVKKKILSTSDITKVCVNAENFENYLQPFYSDIHVNCAGLGIEDLSYYIDTAKTLSLLKTYYYGTVKEKSLTENTKFKITLTNVQDLSPELMDYVRQKEKQLKSLTNRDFVIEVRYDTEALAQKFVKPKDLYIRVVSDIHADYNQNRYVFNFGDDFVINCGDTGGEGKTCVQWNREHIKHGVIVAGNHLGYSNCFPELGDEDAKNTKSYNMHYIAKHLRSNPSFISNSAREYNGVIILGTTLFTDFALYGEEHREEAMQYAKKYINDFRYITAPGHREYTWESTHWNVKKIPREEGKVRKFTPQDHAYYFHFSYQFLKKKVQEYRNKPIVIVTHHAPTPYAISPQYKGSMLNPAFVSNLNEFIVSNPQIRLWCFGHVHNPCDFILGSTRLVCNPFGYNNENNVDLPYNYGTRIRFADVASKTPWTDICAKEIASGQMQVYEN